MEVYKAPIFGHYTQMVWQESSKLGAAMAVGERGIYVVCRYGRVPAAGLPNFLFLVYHLF